PLPAALYYACVLLFAEYRAAIFSVVASLALAAGATGSIILLVLAPFHIGLVALSAQRPASAVAASCPSIVAVLFSTGVTGATRVKCLRWPRTGGGNSADIRTAGAARRANAAHRNRHSRRVGPHGLIDRTARRRTGAALASAGHHHAGFQPGGHSPGPRNG